MTWADLFSLVELFISFVAEGAKILVSQLSYRPRPSLTGSLFLFSSSSPPLFLYTQTHNRNSKGEKDEEKRGGKEIRALHSPGNVDR